VSGEVVSMFSESAFGGIFVVFTLGFFMRWLFFFKGNGRHSGSKWRFLFVDAGIFESINCNVVCI